jgi:hypothetical protein
MTKSPRRLAREALRGARAALPAYSCANSRQDFTRPQLAAIPALKTFPRADYRGAREPPRDFPGLRTDPGPKRVPHYSTRCYAEGRPLKKGGPAGGGGPSPTAPGLRA